MPKIKIGTFNCENLFMRYYFTKTSDAPSFGEKGGPINMLRFALERFKPIGTGQTDHTAKVISSNAPDIIAVQEVENMETLKQFNIKYLAKAYPYAMLIDGNDKRQIDVAVLSKYPLSRTKTHQFERDEDGKLIFSRDCLEVDIAVGAETLTIFVNHFKSKYKDNPAKRKEQATRVAEIVRERFGADLKGNFAVVGDFNDTPDSDALTPLLGLPLENVVQSRVESSQERWTHEYRGKTSQIDYVLLSPQLARNSRDERPFLERRGLAKYVKAYQGERFPGVRGEGTEASDHCAIFMNVNLS